MNYNIKFENERGSYFLEGCKSPISQETLEQSFTMLAKCGLGRTKRIVIDLLAEPEPEVPDADPSMTVDELPLTVRTRNALKALGIGTLRELVCYDRENLRRGRNVGRRTFAEIEDYLAELGIDWRGIE